MNRQVFFDYVRDNLFNGKLSASQVEGMERILDYRDDVWSGMPDNELAYVLATVKWETAHTMLPIKEYGSESYLKSKPYYPWYGRGLVQITWKENYTKFGIKVADDALKWPTALDVCFRGMIFGMFTGKKLSDYISNEKHDYKNARRIINGTDKASEIAKIGEGFRKALLAAQEAPPVYPEVKPPAPVVPPPAPVVPPSVSMSQEDFNTMLYVSLANPTTRQAIERIIAEKLSSYE